MRRADRAKTSNTPPARVLARRSLTDISGRVRTVETVAPAPRQISADSAQDSAARRRVIMRHQITRRRSHSTPDTEWPMERFEL